jgi:hypothetical protein
MGCDAGVAGSGNQTLPEKVQGQRLKIVEDPKSRFATLPEKAKGQRLKMVEDPNGQFDHLPEVMETRTCPEVVETTSFPNVWKPDVAGLQQVTPLSTGPVGGTGPGVSSRNRLLPFLATDAA